VHGQPGDVLTAYLDLSGVDARANGEVERLDCLSDRHGALDGATWAVERGDKAVSGRVHHASPEARDLHANGVVVMIEQVPSAPSPSLAARVGGAHDVGEQDSGQGPLRPGPPLAALFGTFIGSGDRGSPGDVKGAPTQLHDNDPVTGLGADLLYGYGTWVFDSLHTGWNEIHPIKKCAFVGKWDGA